MDRDEPDGREQWIFTVYAQDDDHNGFIANAAVQVILEDVNDNAPLFYVPGGRYNHLGFYAEILENSPQDTEIMTLKAKDFDAGSNAEIKYSIQSKGVNIFLDF